MKKPTSPKPQELPPTPKAHALLGKVQQRNEREITFHVPPRFSIPDHLGTPLTPRVFTSTYFDSTHHRLGQLGITLRKRVEKGQSVWQLKIPSGNQRIELEVQSGSRRVPPQLSDLLIAFFRNSEPHQIGKIRTWRAGICIHEGSKQVAELTLDSVALLTNNKIVSRFQELKLESDNGNEKTLKSLQKVLKKSGCRNKPLQPKIFQALHLAYPIQLKPFEGTASLSEHIRAHLHEQYNQLLLNDPGTRLGRDIEALHQMRVATRRMRALFRTARPFLTPEWVTPLGMEIRWLGSLLGQVRDSDVLLQNFQRQFLDFTDKAPRAFTWILTTFESQRSIARAHLLEGLRSDRYLALLDHLEKSLLQLPFEPSTLTPIDVTRKSIRKLLTAIAHSHLPATGEELHRIRILVKRSRYAVEVTSPFLGKAGSSYLQQAKHTQELLGLYQDTIVGEQRILEIQHHRPPNSVRFLSGMMIERLRATREGLSKDIAKHWKKLNKLGGKL